MIIGNSTVTDVGDTLIISKILSLSSINSFTTVEDVVTDESPPTDAFSREFRYSFDGVNYTDFIELKDSNLSSIDLTDKEIIYFNFLYTVISLTPGQTMTFVSLTLNNSIEIKINTNFDVTKVSAYRSIYRDNKDLLLLTDNQLQKLYYKGINPEYIIRNEEDNSDKDFISLYRAFAEYASLNSILIQRFENIYNNDELLNEYLKEKGVELGD